MEAKFNPKPENGCFLRASRIAAALSVLSMGLGQLYNGQWIKGICFFVLQFCYIGLFFEFLNVGLWGIVTLGTSVEHGDHSIMLLAQGIISLLVIALGLLFYVLNVRDAYKVGLMRESGEKPPTIAKTYQNVTDQGYPYLLITPSLVLLVFVVLFPLLFMVLIAFTNYDLYHSPPAKLVDWVGFNNFFNLFGSELWRNSFISVFQWTVVWTLISTTVQFGLGLFLAILINHKQVKFKRFFRTVLILPWAVPAFVSILVFSGMFDEHFGPINQMLNSVGIESIPWMVDPFWSKIAILLIQFWLGFPFSLALCTGVLQGIPADLYEAAKVDGATAWQKFRQITLPLVLYATAPVLITQYAYNFNNFNVIYLFNKGGPPVPGQTAGGTDILISWVYKLTFDVYKYNYAAAVSIMIAMVVMGFAVYQFRRLRSFQEEDMIQ